MKRAIPVGIENFKELIEKEYYYVDKTDLIRELLIHKNKVSLLTRPRRFGKTLNMSMIRYFFEQPVDGTSNSQLFADLKIAGAEEEILAKQEQFPVISLTLKSAKQPTYEMAYASILDEIRKEYDRHSYVLEGDTLTDVQRRRFDAVRSLQAEPTEYAKALGFLSDCLAQYHQSRVLLLLDEYDVPLENAYFEGFYDSMVKFIGSLFESVLKTNDSLEFAVITGCLRISKESIFTGLNNLEVISILNQNYGEYFGFLETEVQDMLSYYGLDSRMDTMKEWYDGYRFGRAEVYNPWSVVNYCKKAAADEETFPVPEWANTSSNAIVRDLVYRANAVTKDELQQLMDGKTIEKRVQEDITYADIHESEDNLWNFLLFTGYLKADAVRFESPYRYVTLSIPNVEILTIYKDQISSWFRDEMKVRDLSALYRAILSGDTDDFQRELGKLLRETISYMDSSEAFYHGFVLGVMANLEDYVRKSNREAGEGRYDIILYSYDITKPPVILELKLAKSFRDLEYAAEKGLDQIIDRKYAEVFAEDGYQQVLCYGLGFFRKQVRIKMKKAVINE